MNPKESAAYKDAVFFSGHKFVGGPGSPGVLVVKKKLMNNQVPAMPGGGTVLFVTATAQRYLSDTVEREEGGTPDILGSIRLGLAFQLKQRVGPHCIMELERRHVRHVRESLSRNKSIVVLGRQSDNVNQLPIFSLLFRLGNRFLHHNFVCALLNDLFGVQARGGCQCAGPYGARVLGLTEQSMVGLEHALVANINILKPGGTRISFPYFADNGEVHYILDAVHFVADHGWKFLPQYEFNIRTGVWRHVSRAKVEFSGKKLLSALQSEVPSEIFDNIQDPIAHRRENLEQAAKLGQLSITMNAASSGLPQNEKIPRMYEALRWFVYPSEAVAVFRQGGVKPPLSDKIMGPCQPQLYFDPTANRQPDGGRTMKKSKRHRVKMALLGGSCLLPCCTKE
ncbi:hypothetical protein PR003_g25753 [Phytophthora rubi]|uniref:Aminotransferase class V domain-containing protein n=1 Tax=Phytophthora rubi TaxID=129364 RepID=A0A6A3I585_9STRA|nr:hypothetical protein PR002_g24825 [Phytophthora rubi]KAE8979724.1 hypothetical protein PR001_g24470 [Phytophthora rubi]KAE9288647.1 hypothetical protein PR003_g25753 [Phytophthora rubi]